MKLAEALLLLQQLRDLQNVPEREDWLNEPESCRLIARRTLLGLRPVDRAVFTLQLR